MQLVAYGAQDIYLTGNPQITFFKVVYRRHTNFSMETIQQTLSGSSSTPVGGSASSTCVISRNGDLVYRVYARVKSPVNIYISQGYNSIGIFNLFDSVELEIGGQLIDRHTAQWMSVWENLSQTNDNFDAIWGYYGDLKVFGDSGEIGDDYLKHYELNPYRYINVPFNFWFCRNPGLALPLIALQYHEVKLKFSTKADNDSFAPHNILNDGTTPSINYDIFCDYIYLDTDERRRFAQVSHEYLIEQVQIQGGGSTNSHKLNFNHPVKFISWTSENDSQSINSDANIQLNGHDRFSKQSPEYFYKKQFIDYFNPIMQDMRVSEGNDQPDDFFPKKNGQLSVHGNNIAGNVWGGYDKVKYTTYKLTRVQPNATGLVSIIFENGWLKSGYDTLAGGTADKKFGLRVFATEPKPLKKLSGFSKGLGPIGYHKNGQGTSAVNEDAKPFSGTDSRLINPNMSESDNNVFMLLNDFDLVGGATLSNGDIIASDFYILPNSRSPVVADTNEPLVNFTFKPTVDNSNEDISGKCLFITFYTVNVDFLSYGAKIDRTKIRINTEQTLPLNLDTIKLHVNNNKIVGQSDGYFLNAYSFALKPLEHQPSGTCNFSRIDNAKLIFEGGSPPTIDNIYALNYNVLRIMSGMGGLAYSN